MSGAAKEVSGARESEGKQRGTSCGEKARQREYEKRMGFRASAGDIVHIGARARAVKEMTMHK